MPAVQLSYVSIDQVCALNTGTAGTHPPTLSVVNAQDVKMGFKLGEGDVSNRGSKLELAEPCLQGREYTLDMIPDETDAVFTAIRNAMLARTPIELYFANGPIGTAASTLSGGTANVVFSSIVLKVFSGDKEEPLAGAIKKTFTLKPCKQTQTNVPQDNVLIS